MERGLKKRASAILGLLEAAYPFDAEACYLNYDPQKPWQLLVATILSAQCTDARVNMVTEDLFAKYETLEALANADVHELERDVYDTGFFRNKARHIAGAAALIMRDHAGELPSDMAALTALPGVGRKTANVVRGHVFKLPGVVVDTHVKRISVKLGLTKQADPVKIEFELMEILPQDRWMAYNMQIIAHGRAVCTARKPACDVCFLSAQCAHFRKKGG